MRLFIAFSLAVSFAAAQSIPNNRLTFSGGWDKDIGAYAENTTATGLGLSYGYRIRRYIELEAGITTALDPTGDLCSHNGCVDVGDHYFWVPFGVRFVLPIHEGRVEFGAGGGGLFEKYTVASQFYGGGPTPYSAWGGYFAGSAAVALDRSRHWWVGAAPRWYLANGHNYNARDRWFQIAGEFSFRFR